MRLYYFDSEFITHKNDSNILQLVFAIDFTRKIK